MDKVAAFDESKFAELMADPGIIRNRLKIRAAIGNAQRLQEIIKEHGSFSKWLDTHHPLTPDEWTKLFKKTFLFCGGEIVRSFLLSTGYLPEAHDDNCPIYHLILTKKPAWNRPS